MFCDKGSRNEIPVETVPRYMQEWPYTILQVGLIKCHDMVVGRGTERTARDDRRPKMVNEIGACCLVGWW